jgi:hypothetical protein
MKIWKEKKGGKGMKGKGEREGRERKEGMELYIVRRP